MSAQQQPATPPSPVQIFNTIQGHQRAFALKAAVDLDLFTVIGKGSGTVPEIAKNCNAAERGIRILSDCMVVMGFLTKDGNRYSLTADTAFFLDSRSPAYLGLAFKFLMHPTQLAHFERLTTAVRNGGSSKEDTTLAPNDPIWIEFARGMAPMMMPGAQAIAGLLAAELSSRPSAKILDIAASHGLFGITVAQRLPQAHIYALDWANVLEIARENAEKQGLTDRYHLLSGSAFDVDYGTGFDAILITNLLHHFDPSENEKMLKKAHAALNPGGQVIILEFVPNDDRVSPAVPALFSLTMLGNTPKGDAYTLVEYGTMCRNAGFESPRLIPLEPTPESLVVARKAF
ncbi:MAG: methyltransferase protein [Candidatus Angelobacter sp.]|nr:methyltransferase protein [Candidatus Angelobacter sp.]